MHFMPDSAPHRARHRAETTRELVRAARRLTARDGLAGFTIEQLCGEADVSRRTFFNYFASKEDAVLGMPIERGDADAIAEFVAGGPGEHHIGGELSPDLLDALGALTEARFRMLDVAPDTVAELVAAVEREPRLIKRMLETGAAAERDDARLIAARERLDETDLRAETAAQVVGAVSRAAAGEFLSGSSEGFTEIFARRLDALRALFATSTSPEETS
jgi:AcrR family transcriptional regulator